MNCLAVLKNEKLQSIVYSICFVCTMIGFEIAYFVYADSIVHFFNLIRLGFYLTAMMGLVFLYISDMGKKKWWIQIFVIICSCLLVWKFQLTWILTGGLCYFYKKGDYYIIRKVVVGLFASYYILWGALFLSGLIQRNSYWGLTYKNEFGCFALIFSLFALIIFDEKDLLFRVIGIAFAVGLSFFSYKVFHSRSVFYAIVICIVVYFVVLLTINVKNVLWQGLIKWSIILFPGLMMVGTVALGVFLQKYPVMDAAFRCRFVELYTFMEWYGIKLFGSSIIYCNSGQVPYIYGDSMYFRFLFEGGVLVSLIAFGVLALANKIIYDSNQYMLYAVVVAVGSYAMMETGVVYVMIALALALVKCNKKEAQRIAI